MYLSSTFASSLLPSVFILVTSVVPLPPLSSLKGNFREDNFQTAMSSLQDGGGKGGGARGNKRGSSCFKVVKMIMERQLQPVIVFSFSRRDCETFALQMSKLDCNTGERAQERREEGRKMTGCTSSSPFSLTIFFSPPSSLPPPFLLSSLPSSLSPTFLPPPPPPPPPLFPFPYIPPSSLLLCTLSPLSSLLSPLTFSLFTPPQLMRRPWLKKFSQMLLTVSQRTTRSCLRSSTSCHC